MRHLLKSGRAVAVIVVALAAAACTTAKNDLLSAPDPDIINPGDVQSAAGALAVRIGALARIREASVTNGNNGTDGTWLLGGLLADEWSTSSTFVQNDEVDERQISTSNSSVDNSLRLWYRVPTAADQAIELLEKYSPTPASNIAEMYMVRGFAQMQLAQDFCNGIPLSDGASTPVTLGTPLTDEQVFNVAVASYDSALALATGADNASISIHRAAEIGKARALIDLNQPAAAVPVVADVPTTYTYDITSSLTGGNNGIWSEGASQRRYTVGDSLEGNSHNILVKNAIPFFSAQDPRLPVNYTIKKGDTTVAQDGLTLSRTTTLYGQVTPISLVNGIDARLVEAEAALRANQPAQMISILNALRATKLTIGTLTTDPTKLPALTDPGTDSARASLYFREKAFWTFARGQRLSDLRRLVRQYGRSVDEVYPEGTHYRGTTYGSDVNLPVTTGESNGNPNFTGCLDRDP